MYKSGFRGAGGTTDRGAVEAIPYNKCVQNAKERANKAIQQRNSASDVLKEGAAGAIGGAIIGCVTTSAAGCGEGALGGTLL